jgi:hypothetical protein
LTPPIWAESPVEGCVEIGSINAARDSSGVGMALSCA